MKGVSCYSLISRGIRSRNDFLKSQYLRSSNPVSFQAVRHLQVEASDHLKQHLTINPLDEAAEIASKHTAKGKTVNEAGAPRETQRSELYGLKIYYTKGPRDHLNEDGTVATDPVMWSNALRDTVPQKYISVNGQTYITGVEPPVLEHILWNAPRNTRWWQGAFKNCLHLRSRLRLFANYDLIMKTDYCMFWIPTFIVFTITVPAYAMSYMTDEITYTTMTVKVIGRQWYWVFEVESPVDDEDEDQEEEEEDDGD